MKKLLFSIIAMALPFILSAQCGNLYIAGVIDGPLGGGTPKGIQLCASGPVADLTIYGLESANNGGASSAPEFTLEAGALSTGDCIWIASDQAQFNTWFGFDPCSTNSVANINGDDAILLWCSGAVADVFGEVGCDPNTTPGSCTSVTWEHTDGWAVRNTSAPNTTWTEADWSFSGVDGLDGEVSNATAANPYPNLNINCPAAVPTMGQWSLLIMTLTFLSFGLVAIKENTVEMA